jgi:hypothetical protein
MQILQIKKLSSRTVKIFGKIIYYKISILKAYKNSNNNNLIFYQNINV